MKLSLALVGLFVAVGRGTVISRCENAKQACEVCILDPRQYCTPDMKLKSGYGTDTPACNGDVVNCAGLDTKCREASQTPGAFVAAVEAACPTLGKIAPQYRADDPVKEQTLSITMPNVFVALGIFAFLTVWGCISCKREARMKQAGAAKAKAASS